MSKCKSNSFSHIMGFFFLKSLLLRCSRKKRSETNFHVWCLKGKRTYVCISKYYMVPVEMDQREDFPRIFILLSCMYTCVKIGVSSKIDLLKGENFIRIKIIIYRLEVDTKRNFMLIVRYVVFKVMTCFKTGWKYISKWYFLVF